MSLLTEQFTTLLLVESNLGGRPSYTTEHTTRYAVVSAKGQKAVSALGVISLFVGVG